MVAFKLFCYAKNVIEERENYCKFLIPISNFLSHFVSTDMPGANRKSNTWIFIMRTKKIVLIVGPKVLTYLVTFKFRGTHFWCNRKGYLNGKIFNNEKKKEIWPSPMTKPPIPTENSKTKDNTQTPPKTSVTQRLRTDLGRSVGVTSNPTGVVKPVYGIPTFPLTAKAV